MLHEIKVPDLAESTVEATIGTWLKKKGDAVQQGEVLLELDTDKVTLEVSSPCNGFISEINKPEGDIVSVGELLVVVDDSSSDETISETEITTNDQLTPQVDQSLQKKNTFPFLNFRIYLTKNARSRRIFICLAYPLNREYQARCSTDFNHSVIE